MSLEILPYKPVIELLLNFPLEDFFDGYLLLVELVISVPEDPYRRSFRNTV